jgi:hypothetical protein
MPDRRGDGKMCLYWPSHCRRHRIAANRATDPVITRSDYYGRGFTSCQRSSRRSLAKIGSGQTTSVEQLWPAGL